MPETARADGYVLVHGGCHGGWCWDPIVSRLDRPALAVDLPGRNGDPAGFRTTSLADWVASAGEQMAAFTPRRVVLVAHSLGGVTATALAQELPERIHAIVLVSCIVPAEGQTVAATLAGERYQALFRDDGGFWPPAPDAAKNSLLNGVPDTIADPWVARLVPEPSPPFLAPVSYRRMPDVPITYVSLSRDQGLPPIMQQQMIANLGITDVVSIESCHNVMVSEPDALAEIVCRAAG
jgi:pimeloyl-ACP methyl ester carboxylesterase